MLVIIQMINNVFFHVNLCQLIFMLNIILNNVLILVMHICGLMILKMKNNVHNIKIVINIKNKNYWLKQIIINVQKIVKILLHIFIHI